MATNQTKLGLLLTLLSGYSYLAGLLTANKPIWTAPVASIPAGICVTVMAIRWGKD